MRPVYLCLIVTILSAVSMANGQQKAEHAPSPATPAFDPLARDLEIAELKLFEYRRIVSPLEIRRLESTIKWLDARIDSYARRIAVYERLTKNQYSYPALESLEETRLAWTEAKLKRSDLQAELCLVKRFQHRTRRLYELEVERAQAALVRSPTAQPSE